ncbi:MAG: hypothetical protein GVY36_15865 [Verrucomicrobia bacterium]|jgi:hypothetical protein|nr:hypothetical protein [Verrucomicrobiota bacterium]
MQLCLPYLKIKAALVAVSRATARSLMKIEIKEYKKVSAYSGVGLVFILVGILISGPLLKKTEIAIALAILVLPFAKETFLTTYSGGNGPAMLQSYL